MTSKYKLVPVGFCEDTALSLAERTFSTEVDEQLAEDIIQYARRLHGRYTAPQPTPVAWVTADTVDGQTVNGKPRRIWWENNEGVGIPIYATPHPTPEVAKLVETLEGFLAIVADSTGVSGYHLNGNIAKWSEFEEVTMAEEALALYRQQESQP